MSPLPSSSLPYLIVFHQQVPNADWQLHYLSSSVISFGLSPIAALQLSFISIALVFFFHNVKLLPSNISILNFVAIILMMICFSLRPIHTISPYSTRILE
ncbi:hypothetical protein ACOSP7_017071 [Xanthoceras sorbifolium]